MVNNNNNMYAPTVVTPNQNYNLCKNAAIVSGTTAIGAFGGFAKHKFIDIPCLKILNADEFKKYADYPEQVQKNVLQDLQKAYDKISAKNIKKNLLIGAAVGLIAGLASVFAKMQVDKSRK